MVSRGDHDGDEGPCILPGGESETWPQHILLTGQVKLHGGVGMVGAGQPAGSVGHAYGGGYLCYEYGGRYIGHAYLWWKLS